MKVEEHMMFRETRRDGGFSMRQALTLMLAYLVLLSGAAKAEFSQSQNAEDTSHTAPETRVWVNLSSGVYHCPGTRWYGNTKRGEYMSEKQARSSGYRSASGQACGATGSAANLQEQAAKPITRCGYKRWPVKILGDLDRSRVALQPIDSTVAHLGAIPRPHTRFPYNRRVFPEELKVYRVRARLLRVKREQDSDLHILLGDIDHPERRMIAEIPAPECAEGTGYEDAYRTARSTVLLISRDAVVDVVGVAFFDLLHEQTGAAPNGLELHPVLTLRPAR